MQAPETYLGYARGRNFQIPQSVASDAKKHYSFPAKLQDNHWALAGDWKMGVEHSVSVAAGAGLRLDFNARKVFLVLGSASGKPIDVKISLIGKPVGAAAGKDAAQGKLTVTRNTLYELIDQGEMQHGLL